jgi:hypothetical protein
MLGINNLVSVFMLFHGCRSQATNYVRKWWENNAVNCESPPSYVTIYSGLGYTPCFTMTCHCSDGYCYSDNSCSSETISEVAKVFKSKSFVAVGKIFVIGNLN